MKNRFYDFFYNSMMYDYRDFKISPVTNCVRCVLQWKYLTVQIMLNKKNQKGWLKKKNQNNHLVHMVYRA